MKGTLYIVATPIGNLEDISYRAIRILHEVTLIAAEDTRHSGRLLQHYHITTPLISLHEFNEAKRVNTIVKYLDDGKDIALISDAGTPLICDPGYVLVETLRKQNIDIAPIPGPCALIAALSVAGLPTHRFVFEGFLSVKTNERLQQLKSLCHEQRTLIFYEAPHRILKLLEDISSIMGSERPVVIAKEMTKSFETFFYGNAAEACKWLANDRLHQKGEFVVLVHGARSSITTSISENTLQILEILSQALPSKQAAQLTAKITGMKKNQLYKLIPHEK